VEPLRHALNPPGDHHKITKRSSHNHRAITNDITHQTGDRTVTNHRLLTLLLAVLCMSLTACATAQPAQPDVPAWPNVVIILADDLGYGDARCNNPDSTIPTPNLDALAAGGMRFTDAHTPSAVCTPTRYGLLTGRYCWRTRLTRGVLSGYSPHLIDPDRPTIADVMSSAGYHTAAIGKWHLGMDLPRGQGNAIDDSAAVSNSPNVNGFDYFFGVTASLDMPPYVFIENDRFTAPLTGRVEAHGFPSYWRAGELAQGFVHRDALDQITERAIGYITDHAANGEPFFLYLPLTSPHKPTLPAERFVGRSGIGPYGDFVIQTDDVVGRIDRALADAGVRDSTLVIVTSDNGSYMYRLGEGERDHTDDDSIQAYRAQTHTANDIYRGTKADIYEAGHRVFFAARWPGVIEPGSVADQTVSLVDVYATLAEAVGQPLAQDAAEDSISMLSIMTGEAEDYARPPVIMHSANGTFAIRMGQWKLIASEGSGGREQPRGEPFGRPYQLYDLVADPSETTNLIEQHPEIAQRMEAMLEQIRASGRSR